MRPAKKWPNGGERASGAAENRGGEAPSHPARASPIPEDLGAQSHGAAAIEERVPFAGMQRKTRGERLSQSTQTAAHLSSRRSATSRAIKALRARLKGAGCAGR